MVFIVERKVYKMHNNFLITKIEKGFEEERQLLKHEVDKHPKLPLLSYIRPIFFAVLLMVTLIALGFNVAEAVRYFIVH